MTKIKSNVKTAKKISSRKAKGRSLQKWVCEQISKLLDTPWGRGDDMEISPRPMGQPGPDVVMSKQVREKFPLTCECKNQESWNIISFIEQAKTNIYPNTDWLLIIKKNKIKPLVVLDAEVFFRLLYTKTK